MAEELGNRKVCVHVTNADFTAGEICAILRPGDIFCHAMHAKGKSAIIGSDGHVLPEVRNARERGVLFDAANGRNHFSFSFDIAAAAIADGFLPDIISTDATLDSAFAAVFVDNLVVASLWGVHSHGVGRFPIYMERLAKNLVNRTPAIAVETRFPAVLSVDGDNGLGR